MGEEERGVAMVSRPEFFLEFSQWAGSGERGGGGLRLHVEGKEHQKEDIPVFKPLPSQPAICLRAPHHLNCFFWVNFLMAQVYA